MKTRKTIIIKTEKQFTPLNELISDFVKDKKGIGQVHIFVRHSTCGIKIIENEILLLADINNYLEEIAPRNKIYMHDKIEIRDVPIDERINGFSHIRQLQFPTSETIPVQDGKPMLGQWQTVFLVEFDPIRDREIVFTYI
ncbi:MAG: secondary thiamine-phosphate synthase enzyme YjbQ [Bacteroidetes bacterium]|nr:secondary thiamine-phosphate synthase enzyme YjbQ [Bacteroidota bacterium]